MIRAGRLDREITIQRALEVVDYFGVPRHAWTAVATLRAERVEAAAVEENRAHGASSERTITFRTRYHLGISLADRVLFEGEAYDIKEVRELGRRRGLELKVLARGTP